MCLPELTCLDLTLLRSTYCVPNPWLLKSRLQSKKQQLCFWAVVPNTLRSAVPCEMRYPTISGLPRLPTSPAFVICEPNMLENKRLWGYWGMHTHGLGVIWAFAAIGCPTESFLVCSHRFWAYCGTAATMQFCWAANLSNPAQVTAQVQPTVVYKCSIQPIRTGLNKHWNRICCGLGIHFTFSLSPFLGPWNSAWHSYLPGLGLAWMGLLPQGSQILECWIRQHCSILF